MSDRGQYGAPVHGTHGWIGGVAAVALGGLFIYGAVKTVREIQGDVKEERSWKKWTASGLSKSPTARAWPEERAAWRAWEKEQRR